MKLRVLFALCLCLSLVSIHANTLPAGKAYRAFQVGVTGFDAQLSAEGVLSVAAVKPGTPADGRVKVGDVLLAVNGESLKVQDPRPLLGESIDRAEGRNGELAFDILRGKERTTVSLELEPIGSYSKTWPLKCKKSERIIRDTAEFIVRNGPGGAGITGSCEALFLLSTGDDQYLPVLKDYLEGEGAGKVGNHTWNNGYRGLFLGEYYLRTGDEEVFPILTAICNDARDRQYYGGWNHWGGPGTGYVTGGLMNPAGAQMLTSLILARECGLPSVDEGTYDRGLQFFFRFAGHGAVPYGDHHPTMYLGDNGKDGMLACALGLLPGEKFQGASQVLALSEADSYTMNEQGHGSPFGNQTWRGIASVLVPRAMQNHYRRHMDKLKWYYDLCRMPGGGFRTPPMPGSGKGSIGGAPSHQTGLIALSYTAPLRNLRITGKPRTQHSVKHRPTKVEKDLEHTDFHKPYYADGGGDLGLEPHEIYAKFSPNYGGWWRTPHAEPQSIEWYRVMMRHYSPMVRSFAAHGMGMLGEEAVPEIVAALESPDARVRVAGMEAISGVLFWGVGFTRVNITSDLIRDTFLPYLVKPLKDRNAPMWEKRHALMALSRADHETIASQTDLIKPYLSDQNWYLRVAAFNAVRQLVKETERVKPFVPAMVESYSNDHNLPSLRWGSTTVFKEMLAVNDDLRLTILEGMAKKVNTQAIRTGYHRPIDINNIFETMRYIDMKGHPEHVIPILPAVQRVFPELGGSAAWVFTGARWGNIGLIKAAEALGEDAGPVIDAMKALLPEVRKKAGKGGREGKAFEPLLPQVVSAIAAYERTFATPPEGE